MYKYKAVKIEGVKYDEHRYIMEQHLGRKLDSDEIVHHLNENPKDNQLYNLQVVTRAEHSRIHRIGKKLSEETKQKLSETRLGKPNIAQRVLTNEQVDFIREKYKPGDKEFGARALGKKFGVNHSTISRVVNGILYERPV